MKLKGPEQHNNKNYGNHRRMRMYWRRLMDSTQKKLSAGAAAISKIISFARKDNWRRKKN